MDLRNVLLGLAGNDELPAETIADYYKHKSEEKVIPSITADNEAVYEGVSLDPHKWDAVERLLAIPLTKGGYIVESSPSHYAFIDTITANRPVVGFNIKELYKRTRPDIQLLNPSFDALLALYLLDVTAKHSVNYLAQTYLNKIVNLPDFPTGIDEGIQVAHIVAQSQPVLLQHLEELNLLSLYNDIELPLSFVLAEMEYQGIKLDLIHLAEIGSDLHRWMKELETPIYELAGGEFNINSPKQLADILYNKLGYPKGRRTASGYSTEKSHLVFLEKGDRPIVGMIKQWRSYAKLASGYTDSLPKKVKNGIIYCHFNQAITETGRLSSSDPNLQNQPKVGELGPRMRASYVSKNKDWLILAADYSQVELRVLAHYSGDETLIRCFNEGEDLHTVTAMKVFGCEKDEVTKDQRRLAKIVNFSIPYGTTAHGLAGQIDREIDFAEELRSGYLERFPKVQQYMVDKAEEARINGYAETLLGRRRPIVGLNSSDRGRRGAAERQAINHPIQGSAADIMKLALINIQRELTIYNQFWHEQWINELTIANLLLQVHDEAVLEVYPDHVQAIADIVKNCMSEAYQLIVPLDVEVKVGKTWGTLEALTFAA